MVCDNCGQNEAIIHLTHIEDNQVTTKHLCEECAAEKGLQSDANVNFPLTDFLAQVGKAGPEASTTGPCPFCGMKLEEFKKTGRLGCPQCYVSFECSLKGLLRRLHGGGVQHVGKVYLPPNPSESQQQERLAGLRRKLSRAVEHEDFERAAEIRDLIRSIEDA